MSLSVNVSGAWKNVPHVSARVSGSWRTVSNIYTRVSGVWKPAFSARRSIAVTYASSTQNANIFIAAGSPSGTTPVDVTVTINSNVWIGASSTGNVALQTGTGWPAGSTITIINYGTITGAGGVGGVGGWRSEDARFGWANGTTGGQGGPALYLQWPVTVYNYGGIYGGGGGGGGGGGIWAEPIGNITIGTTTYSAFAMAGGSAGGGAGYNGGGGGASVTPNEDGSVDIIRAGGAGSSGGTGGAGSGNVGGSWSGSWTIYHDATETYSTNSGSISGGRGGNGGGFGATGAAGVNGSYSGDIQSPQTTSSAAGASPGYYCMRNGNTLSWGNVGSVAGLLQ